MGRAWVICKKIFSISLVFNALITIACAVGIIAGFYYYYSDWHPFAPYLIHGSIFWVVIAAAIINLYPSAMLGRKLHTGRFLFHHYFYGLLVLVCACLYVVFFTHSSLLTIFFVNNTSVEINIGRFFILGGLTLLLDDLTDVSIRIESHLNRLKAKALNIPRFLIVAQIITGLFALYLSAALLLGMLNVPEWVTVANFLLLLSAFFTAITSFIFAKRRFWRNVELTNPDQGNHH
jgi:hypothetical protein